jgi:uncharacterized repeat protein (TIGR03803 family)
MRSSKPRFLCSVLVLLALASVNSTARGQAFGATNSILWSFGNGSDGQAPAGDLIRDTSGNLYGTTQSGGANSYGTVFKLTAQGNESVLWSFGHGTDGAGPQDGLIMDPSGNLYCTTGGGGGGTYGSGTVFKLTPPSTIGGNWSESILWSFCSQSACADGESPSAGLLMDASGNLYGTTVYGGAHPGGPRYAGVVFKLTAQGNESVLWSFGSGTDGAGPLGGLIMDASGQSLRHDRLRWDLPRAR